METLKIPTSTNCWMKESVKLRSKMKNWPHWANPASATSPSTPRPRVCTSLRARISAKSRGKKLVPIGLRHQSVNAKLITQLMRTLRRRCVRAMLRPKRTRHRVHPSSRLSRTSSSILPGFLSFWIRKYIISGRKKFKANFFLNVFNSPCYTYYGSLYFQSI